ncbi:SH3 domain-containing protein [Neobacillus niacini]|uniref:SH3 domain-containing protein n=1 Tax=Neobacillus niacini TaxID=86668 RepID=UPI0021CB00C5|nr:SH3 domain-containing protein [Neobacillus niacini]MCM3763752.1 SH3 domain-containing protein [Neobacillus niacini]
MPEWMTNLFDSMMNLVYKLYIVLMGLSAPIRMAVLILIAFIVFPYAIKLLVWLVHFLIKNVIKFLEAASNKMGSMTINRRKQGKNPVPGIGLIDALFTGLVSLGTKLRNSIQKIPAVKPKTKKNYKWVAALCVIGLPLWGLMDPTGKVGTAWANFEGKLVIEHLQPLGYDPGTYKSLELASSKMKNSLGENNESTASANTNYYITPNEKSKNGVYVREGPSINASDVHVLPYGEYAQYLGEQQTDGEGRTWYKVQINETLAGWISSRVVDIYENKQ